MELRGKTILITRAAAQSQELRDGLERFGARVLECPTIELLPVDDWSDVDRAINTLNSYQWLLFTSANAVDYFMKRVEALGASCSTPIAVVGSATAGKLAEWHLAPTLIPRTFSAEGLLEVFPSSLPGVRILFPRAETARELLPEELRRRGALVDVVTVYRTLKAAAGVRDLRTILRAEKIDCIVFTSPSAVHFMADAVEDLSTVLEEAVVAVIGPATREAAASHGLRSIVQAERSTIPDLIDTVRRLE